MKSCNLSWSLIIKFSLSSQQKILDVQFTFGNVQLEKNVESTRINQNQEIAENSRLIWSRSASRFASIVVDICWTYQITSSDADGADTLTPYHSTPIWNRFLLTVVVSICGRWWQFFLGCQSSLRLWSHDDGHLELLQIRIKERMRNEIKFQCIYSSHPSSFHSLQFPLLLVAVLLLHRQLSFSYK